MKKSVSKVLLITVLFLSLFTIHGSLITSHADAACSQAIPTSFKAEILAGAHESTDTYKVALYLSANATLGAATTSYTATGEISGTGYTAGGMTIAGFNVTTSGTTAILDFTTDPAWTNSTITADCYLIYNSTNANKAVYVGTITSTSSTNGTWTLIGPTPDASNGWVRLN